MSTKTGRYGDGWDELERLVDPARFAQVLPQATTKHLVRIGQNFVRDARKAIQAKKYAANSPLTIAMKGSSTPLVKDGDLIGSLIADVAPDGMTLWVGVNRTAKGKNGKLEKVAEYLHDGAVVDLQKHPKVGFAVMMQLKDIVAGKRRGDVAKAQELLDKWGTGDGAKGKWVIPARPFIGDITESPEFEAMCNAELRAAVAEALGLSGRDAA